MLINLGVVVSFLRDTRAQLCKRTEWATLLARECCPDYREASLQCRGWQAMKPTRALFKGDRVSEG